MFHFLQENIDMDDEFPVEWFETDSIDDDWIVTADYPQKIISRKTRRNDFLYHPNHLKRLYLMISCIDKKSSYIKRRSIYVSATISLVTRYHNISGKAFIQTECYKRFSSNALPGRVSLVKVACVIPKENSNKSFGITHTTFTMRY